MTEIFQSFLHPVYHSNTSFLEKKETFREAIFFILKGWGIFILLLLMNVSQKQLTHVSLLTDLANRN